MCGYRADFLAISGSRGMLNGPYPPVLLRLSVGVANLVVMGSGGLTDYPDRSPRRVIPSVESADQQGRRCGGHPTRGS
jgi:hypothetical protein